MDLRAQLRARLPHDVRRRLHQFRRRDEFAEYQRRRIGMSTDFADYRDFERTGTLFIHVPKVAGASIWQAVYGRQLTAHVALETYAVVYPRSVFDGLFTFAFVRNPWHRARSAYDFLVAQRDTKEHRVFFRNTLAAHDSFDDFVAGGLATGAALRHPLFKTQISWVRRHPGGPPAVDFLGRYEHLSDDVAALARRIEIPVAVLPHLHRTSRASVPPPMSASTTEIVGELYREDVEAFGYEPPTAGG